MLFLITGAIFCILKAEGKIKWKWIWVTSPFWIYGILLVFAVIAGLIIGLSQN